jgi:drug/metabolite transporter (DMT)-like permease
VLAGIVTAFLWALTAMLIRLDDARLSALTINTYRVTIASLPFIAYFLIAGDLAKLLGLSSATLLTLVLSVLLAMVGGATLNFIAILKLGLARAFPISSAYPLGTLVLAALVLDEAIGPRQALGGLVTLLGVALVALANGQPTTQQPHTARDNLIGLATAVGAAINWALASIITKLAINDVDLVTASTIRLPAAAIVLWLILIWREGWPPRPLPWRLSGRSWLVLIAAGLLGPALSAYLWMFSMSQIGAARADIIAATSPIFASLLAVGVLRETIGRRAIVGTLLSVGGIMLIL